MCTDYVFKFVDYILEFLPPNIALSIHVKKHNFYRKFGSLFIEFSAIAL